MRPRSLSALAAALLFAPMLSAAAQTPPQPRPFSGTVASLDGTLMSVRKADGGVVSVTVPADVRIGALENRKLADIKPGEFVGSAAVKGMDGKLHALEVHIFPEGMRGTGEGHRPMGAPDQTMTNATVAEVAAAPSGQQLTLKYPGGEQVIEVAPNVRIVALIDGDRSLLKPGAAVTVFASEAAGGALTARFVQAEKAGVKPLSF